MSFIFGSITKFHTDTSIIHSLYKVKIKEKVKKDDPKGKGNIKKYKMTDSKKCKVFMLTNTFLGRFWKTKDNKL